jgi:prevent-host-death family protein
MVRISELRDRLSRYLDHVRAGGRVVILDRNRPVAEIVPVGTSTVRRGDADDGRLGALQREGLVRKDTGRIPSDLVRGAGSGKGAHVLDALLEERESAR